jgi:pimeloyl-ACP methyl ester carboxylesterase
MRRLGAVIALALAGGAVYVFFIAKPNANPRFEPVQDDRLIPHVSTRGSYRNGKALDGAPSPYVANGAVPGISSVCAGEVMIVVHGFNNSPDKALNRFGVARQALQKSGYQGVVVGFSWDADTQHDPYSMTGYHAGRAHARDAGMRLAKLVDAMKRQCPLMKVRIIGYSMGARVALESLLHVSEAVDSVHLVGAAMDNEEVEIGQAYGEAIERRAARVINYYSPEDSKLGLFFWAKEGDRALGKYDIEHLEKAPKNYVSVNAAEHLPEVDDGGLPLSSGKRGANHSGYLGTRDGNGILTDDGVMDLVARDCR